MWRTYFVSACGGDGRNLLIENDVDGRAAVTERDLHRFAVKVAGRKVPVLAFAAIGSQLNGLTVGAMEGFINVEQRLHVVVAGRHVTQAANGISERFVVDSDRLARL